MLRGPSGSGEEASLGQGAAGAAVAHLAAGAVVVAEDERLVEAVVTDGRASMRAAGRRHAGSAGLLRGEHGTIVHV